MFHTEHHQEHFKASLSKALESVRRVLDVDRSAKLRMADEVDHEYKDKYKLADLMTNMSIVTLVSALEKLGLTKEILRSIDTSKETTLRFSTTESCTFVKEGVVDEPLPLSKVTKEITTSIEASESTSQKSMVRKIQNIVKKPTTESSTIETIVKRVLKQEYLIEKDWELSIYSGTDVKNRKIIQKRNGATCEYVRELPLNQKDENPPFSPKKEYPHIEMPLTWLLKQIDPVELKSHFTIDTSPQNNSTKTPVQNPQMAEVTSFFNSVNLWARGVEGHLNQVQRRFWNRQAKQFKEPADAIFIPIIPLMVNQMMNDDQESSIGGGGEDWEETSPSSVGIEPNYQAMVALPQVDTFSDCEQKNLSKLDTTNFLNEHTRTLSRTLSGAEEDFVDLGVKCNLISPLEFKIGVLSVHIQHLRLRFSESIRYIERMLRVQLTAAIGKEVGKYDLDQFIRYHNDKMFNPKPERFCYTIRRPDHYPDGILGIEEIVYHEGKPVVESISTHVREVPSRGPIKVPLNAATTISLTGKTHLHGWLNHRFCARISGASIRLNARARQFSSFVLVVGTMTNQNQLQPKDAIILRNKDEVRIPLLLNEIPTATEFKDAIASLSPEQQRFAKSFRSMQLESSVLGVCVIQIKPQLERLLGLPKDSLTKEMKLTEDLTELFIEYQVPSDLVSCDHDSDAKSNHASVKDQVANVREHVKSVMDVIVVQKQAELEEQKKAAEMAKAQEKQRLAQLDLIDERSQELLKQNSAYGFAIAETPRPSRCATLCAAPPGAMAGSIITRSDGKKVRRIRKTAKAPRQNNLVATGRIVEACSAPLGKESAVFTAMPKILDTAIELHDKNGAIRSTTMKTADKDWTRIRQESLLSKPKTLSLGETEIASERSRAFDLLDALSRSGSLDIPFSELHVLICATHSFDKSVMDTVIQDNVNPIEKLEMSTLLMASTILGVPSRDLIRGEENRNRLEKSFPLLLSNGAENETNDADDDAEIDGDNAIVINAC